MPFALIYGSVGALVAAAVAGWMEAAVHPIASLARAVLPAAISDLAMVFPRQRGIAARVPIIRIVPYSFFGILWIAELGATFRSSHSTMLVVQHILAAGSVIAIALLCLSCILSIRESPSRIERRQAKVFLQGIAALGFVVGSLWSIDSPSGIRSAVTVGAVLSPLPLGYAIARYHLFDLDVSIRRAAARIVYLLAVSMVVFTPLLLLRDVLDVPTVVRPAPVLFALIFAVVWPLDWIRSWLSSSIETAFRPRGFEWTGLSDDPPTPGVAHLRDPEAIAVAASEALEAGFPNTQNAIFWKQGGEFYLASATGAAACTDSRLVVLASRLFPSGPTDLNRVELGDGGESLFRVGVEASCPISIREDVVGWILLSPTRREPFISSGHLGFLASIASQAAAAFEASRLTEALIVAEQYAATGRIHAELAHEIGKPLGTLQIIAGKLGKMSLDRKGRSTARSIERLAAQIREIVRRVLEDRPASSEAAPVQLGDIVERALFEFAEVRGRGHVVVHPLPTLHGLPMGSHRLVRVLINLLHNAIEASNDHDTIQLRAAVTESELLIEVEDSGCGMTQDQTYRAMKPFETFRHGGTGLGLAISKEIVTGLGGRIVLESEAGRGTLAQISIPRDETRSNPVGHALPGDLCSRIESLNRRSEKSL
ncbi:MAG: GHKL domain-containing protein [bacterium]|nr:GHKL domain-containing protein [bacterium]